MARIVVAEDDPDIHLLVQLLLEDQGHVVVMASNGAQALNLVAEAPVDLVILDIAMPGDLDGLAVTRNLRADPARADVPILLLSARAREGDIQVGMDAGANDYIVKPFDADELVVRVASLTSSAG
ncbi:response regulator transcription factor [Nocardioides salsibiostraticola]